MNKINGIYKITNPKGKVYIGQSNNILLRFNHYKNLRCKPQRKLYYSLKKYGIDKHKFEIIHICKEAETSDLEKYYIQLFQCFNTHNGLNLQSGGGNYKFSDETLKLLSNRRKGKRLSNEHKENISNARMGIVPWNKGIKLNDQIRKNISEAKKGDKNPAKRIEVRLKISEKAKKRILTDQQKKKISDKLKGRIFTPEHRLNLKKAWERIKEKEREKIVKY